MGLLLPSADQRLFLLPAHGSRLFVVITEARGSTLGYWLTASPFSLKSLYGIFDVSALFLTAALNLEVQRDHNISNCGEVLTALSLPSFLLEASFPSATGLMCKAQSGAPASRAGSSRLSLAIASAVTRPLSTRSLQEAQSVVVSKAYTV